MALFTVNRYLGDEEEESSEEEVVDKADALAKLKAEALKRKAEREAGEKKAKKLKKDKSKKRVSAQLDGKKQAEEVLQTHEAVTTEEKETDEDGRTKSEDDVGDSSAQQPSVPVDGAPPDPAEEGGKVPDEIGGFTILSATERKEKAAVDRVLPEWLSKPSVIAVDLHQDASLIADDPTIDDRLKSSLRLNGILHFFPVQRHVVPFLLSTLREETLYAEPGFLRPNDVCVSAPTGSGKTLAFVVPILQALSRRVVVRVRALVVLPVNDLAFQVYKVFAAHAACLGLKVGLAVSGHGQSLTKERASLVARSHASSGVYRSKVDILVATPGRLVDHLRTTPGFSLRYLRFLVIDEADRMMDDIKQDWLEMVEDSALKGVRRREADPRRSLCLGGVDEPLRPMYPLQKLLFSATLSQNPEKLESLKLFQPKLFTSVEEPIVADNAIVEDESATTSTAAAPKAGQFIGKFTTPTSLSEYTCFVKNPSVKPLIVLYFIAHLKFKRVLVFANTKENARRLLHLTRGFDGGAIAAREFSSNLTSEKRERILKQFDQEKVDMIICTDAMARGMDVPGVKWVISYDCPIYVKVTNEILYSISFR